MNTTIQDVGPAIGSEFNPNNVKGNGGDYHSTVIAVENHGYNDLATGANHDTIEQYAVLVANHHTNQRPGQQEQTWSCTYTVYIIERTFDADGNLTDHWKVLYEHQFENIQQAVNGIQEPVGRWATEAEKKKEPRKWLAGFVDSLAKP